MKKDSKLVTFEQWRNNNNPDLTVWAIAINPAEVASVEDYCGKEFPGSRITMRGGGKKTTHLVAGEFSEIVAKLNWREA